jgi:hypothetical protein
MGADQGHYLLRGAETPQNVLDWLSFISATSAIIGRKTRDLLKEKGVKQGKIECSVRHSQWKDHVITLPVQFV